MAARGGEEEYRRVSLNRSRESELDRLRFRFELVEGEMYKREKSSR